MLLIIVRHRVAIRSNSSCRIRRRPDRVHDIAFARVLMSFDSGRRRPDRMFDVGRRRHRVAFDVVLIVSVIMVVGVIVLHSTATCSFF